MPGASDTPDRRANGSANARLLARQGGGALPPDTARQATIAAGPQATFGSRLAWARWFPRPIAGVSRIAGIDEAGRGALAGPVVAAAAILPEKFRHRRLNDSKQLASELREEIYCQLISNPEIRWTVGIVDSVEIDRINILRASHRAMRIAIEALLEPPDHVLIDGLPVIPFPLPQTAIIDGDCISLSIAAASVIAKVTRDRIMRDFCAQFPQYCFSQHKGYGTELHLLKLHEFGPCPIHRRSFEPVAQPLLALEEIVQIRSSPARRARREISVPVPEA